MYYPLYDGDTRKRRYCTAREVKRTAQSETSEPSFTWSDTVFSQVFTLEAMLLHSSGNGAAPTFFGHRMPADVVKYLYLLSTNTVSLIYNNDFSDIHIASLSLLHANG